MPDFKDLEEIKDEIKNIGDEKNILDEKGMPIDDSPIPEENTITESSVEPSIEDMVDNGEEDLLGDILEDFEKGHVITEESIDESEIPLMEEGKEPESEDFQDLMLDADMKDEEKIETGDEGLEALLGNGFEDASESGSYEIVDDTGDIGLGFEDDAGLGDFNEIQQKEEVDQELGDLGNIFEEDNFKDDSPVVGDEELDALLSGTFGEQKDMQEEPYMQMDEDISDFMKEAPGESPKIEEEGTSEEILDKIGEEEESADFGDLPDLESLLGEESIESDFGQPVIEKEAEVKEEEFNQDLEMPDFIAEEDKELAGFEDITGEEDKEIGDVEIPDEFNLGSKDDEFDLSKFETFESDTIGDYPDTESKENEFADTKGFEVKDSTYGEIPEEISKEDLEADHDIELKFTDDERKQIVISLTSLPKEVEIKISRAIVSNKYSNAQLKPLINALIDKESPHILIKYYEKITGDKSLSALEGIKYTGVKFEERKKTLSYIFEKNILPFLAKISVAVVIVALLGLFVLYVIKPTYVASKLYKEGRKLIDNKYYLEGEEKFQKAFDEQARFREVVKYARKYREHKRYLATEEKYELALNMRPKQNNIVLEYSDFLREKKDFERAERMYKGLIKTDREKLSATLGLAKTYYDWAEEEAGKLEDAKEAYKDALDIDSNNKEAVFGNLKINIKQKNHKAVLAHYDYIEKKIKGRVDPEAYSDLAEYFLSTGNINDVKNVLERASKSIKRNEYFPEIEYQFANYKKQLNIYNEEKNHLKKTLTIFEKMEKEAPGKFESSKRLRARVYNDLGENEERSVKASPEAEKYYRKAIQIDKDYGKPYYNLANFSLKYKPGGYDEAKGYYLKAEENGFINDRLNYNLGWVYYKENDFYNSYNRIINILEKQPENSNLKFMIGTIFYKLGKYELSESLLLENYIHFMDLKAMYDPLDPGEKEDKIIMEMLKKVSNNLGASYQKRYEETRNSRYIIKASKYYADSILFFDKLENIYVSEVDAYKDDKDITSQLRDKKGNANINFRMVLFPYAGIEEPILYEDFPLDFMIFM